MHFTKSIIVFIILLVSFTLNAQTGPAGVGSSTNNVLWLKADAGTSTTSDGAAIDTWADQSGNGIDVSQSNTAQKPTFKSSLMNGYPAIEFDNNSAGGQNDFLTAANNAILDNTDGYSFFTVSRLKGISGSAQTIVSKRTTIDIDEAFMLFYFTSNYLYMDIDGIGDRFNSSPASYSNNTNYIFDGFYNGTLAANNRSTLYENETLRKTSTETSSFVDHKNSPLIVGATHITDNRAFNGYIPEIIIYRTALNDAQRIIINNYLSSKYDIPLHSNDKYTGDLIAKGGYFREVAGIGMESTGGNTEFSSSVNGGLGISANSGLEYGDYLLSGYAESTNSQINTDIGGMTGLNNATWKRIWYWDVTNNATNINANITFNLLDGSISSTTLGDASDYVLLYRATIAGNWTELAVASAISGDDITFNNITITNDGYYTIGTHNAADSPLPIQLISFNAKSKNNEIELTFSTASEYNNDYFTIAKSNDGYIFDNISTIPSNGNSNNINSYTTFDKSPQNGITYYRLQQTDFDGNYTFSNIIAVNYKQNNATISILNHTIKTQNTLAIETVNFENKHLQLLIFDSKGIELYSKKLFIPSDYEQITIDFEKKLIAGMYSLVAITDNTKQILKFIVK